MYALHSSSSYIQSARDISLHSSENQRRWHAKRQLAVGQLECPLLPSCFNRSCQYKNVLLGLGSDVGIIIEGSIILIFVDRNC